MFILKIQNVNMSLATKQMTKILTVYFAIAMRKAKKTRKITSSNNSYLRWFRLLPLVVFLTLPILCSAAKRHMRLLKHCFLNITYMYIKDDRKDGVNVPAGEGAGDIPKILKTLSEKNYNVFLCLEPHLGL